MNNQIKYGRKRSGIKKQLDQKLAEWLESITDENVRNAARADVIVTGGAIASMLIGEKINDYDIYFRTKETAQRIAEYYVEKFREKVSDTYDPRVLIESIENIKGVEEERVVIKIRSAGIVKDEDYQDYYDTLNPNEAAELLEETVDEMKGPGEPYRPVFMSQNAITLSNAVQIIIRFYGEPDQIHSNYDFVHAKCFYDLKNNDLVFPPEALEALLSRTLIYQGSLYPIASIFRMKKFIERGWRITAGQQLKIMWQISEIDLSDFNILKEQLTGVDMAYMFELIEALRDIDTNKINSTYVAAIIEKIFD